MESVEFFYRKFFYNRHTLTPRLETESLVRLAIETVKKNHIDTLIDVGTGSSIIGISIEKNSQIEEIYGLDKSINALKIAKMNLSAHNSNLKLIKSDLLDCFFKNPTDYNFESKDMLLVANLPYIKNEDWINMSSDTRFEPKMALFGGKKTGFELYEKYFRELIEFKKLFKINRIYSISEIGFDQKDVAQEFFDKISLESKFYPDLRGIERFIYCEI